MWYLMLGGLMLAIAFLNKLVKRLPITTTIVYLLVGIALGPIGLDLIYLDPIKDAAFLERITELAVIVSLFTAGLKLSSSLGYERWKISIRLAFGSMLLTVGMIAFIGVVFLHFSLGAAILLGAILAPTDPVLASDVQLDHPDDRDRLRYSLTGEAGLNDGTAFPFVMLGLGLIGLHEIGTAGWLWFTVDLLWAVVAGLGIGALTGIITGKLVVALRKGREETIGRDEFIALGLIGFSYGLAVLMHAYGFLAVFAAGLAFRHFELENSKLKALPQESYQQQNKVAQIDATGKPPVYVAGAVLSANEQLERMMEIAIVLIMGAMLSSYSLALDVLWFAPLIFLIIRPASVVVGTIRGKVTKLQRMLLCWFGIRGIGSLYYLMFAIQHGLPEELALRLSSIVISLVAMSIVVHGISVTPIMNRYYKKEGIKPKG